LPETVDFEARLVDLVFVGAGVDGKRFRVAWYQAGALYAADLLWTAAALRIESCTKLAGATDARVSEGPQPHLHSGKLHASMTADGVLFTHRGFVRFVRLP
jgi:hypothetical protein